MCLVCECLCSCVAARQLLPEFIFQVKYLNNPRTHIAINSDTNTFCLQSCPMRETKRILVNIVCKHKHMFGNSRILCDTSTNTYKHTHIARSVFARTRPTASLAKCSFLITHMCTNISEICDRCCRRRRLCRHRYCHRCRRIVIHAAVARQCCQR